MYSNNRIDGKELAKEWLRELKGKNTSERYLVGFVSEDNAAGHSFQKAKRRAARWVGIEYLIIEISESSTEKLVSLIQEQARDKNCGGIVVQLPLPAYFNTEKILDAIPAEKDPDVLGTSAKEKSEKEDWIIPPPARVVSLLLEKQSQKLEDLSVAIVGMGRLIGEAIAPSLEGKVKELHLLDKGFDEALLKKVDLVILGTGNYELDPSLLQEGVGVIDFGYKKTEEGLMGDLMTKDKEALEHLSFYTPTPGGTGPLLIAALLENVTTLNNVVDDTGLEPVTSSV